MNCEVAEFCHFAYCKIKCASSSLLLQVVFEEFDTVKKFQLNKLAFDWNVSLLSWDVCRDSRSRKVLSLKIETRQDLLQVWSCKYLIVFRCILGPLQIFKCWIVLTYILCFYLNCFGLLLRFVCGNSNCHIKPRSCGTAHSCDVFFVTVQTVMLCLSLLEVGQQHLIQAVSWPAYQLYKLSFKGRGDFWDGIFSVLRTTLSLLIDPGTIFIVLLEVTCDMSDNMQDLNLMHLIFSILESSVACNVLCFSCTTV